MKLNRRDRFINWVADRSGLPEGYISPLWFRLLAWSLRPLFYARLRYLNILDVRTGGYKLDGLILSRRFLCALREPGRYWFRVVEVYDDGTIVFDYRTDVPTDGGTT